MDLTRLAPPRDARLTVLGGCGGIGRALVRAAQANGLRVAILDLPRSLDEHPPPADVETWPLDATVEAEVVRAFGALEARWGGFDHLVNLAGFATDAHPLDAVALDDWQAVLDGSLRTTFLACRAAVPLIRRGGGGSIVNMASGLAWTGHTQNATFFDADCDGDLDLLISNTARWTTAVRHPKDHYYEGVPGLYDLVDSPKEYNVFYRNRGDGTFEDATEEAGLRGPGWAGDVAVFDYDGDRDPDVFVANMFGRSTLYRNDGKGVFRNVTGETLGKTPFGTVGARAFDYDNDGRFDLMLVDMHSDMWMPSDYDPEKIDEKAKYRGFHGALLDDPSFDRRRARLFNARMGVDRDEVFFGNALYRNRGDGTFEEVSDAANAETFWPWGIAAADFDNDTWMDAFLPSGMGYPFFYWRNYLLMNNGDGTFTDRAREAGLDPPPGGELLGEIAGEPATRSSRSAASGPGRSSASVRSSSPARMPISHPVWLRVVRAGTVSPACASLSNPTTERSRGISRAARRAAA